MDVWRCWLLDILAYLVYIALGTAIAASLADQGSPGTDWTQLLVTSCPVDQTTEQLQGNAIGWSFSWLTRLVAPSPVDPHLPASFDSTPAALASPAIGLDL